MDKHVDKWTEELMNGWMEAPKREWRSSPNSIVTDCYVVVPFFSTITVQLG